MFELLRVGNEQEIKSATTYKSYDESNIDDKEQVRDLGIMMPICLDTATLTLHNDAYMTRHSHSYSS